MLQLSCIQHICGLGDGSPIQVILIPLPFAQAVHPQVTSKIPLFNELIVQRYEVHYHHNVILVITGRD